MKKSVFMLMMILGFAIQQPVYEKIDEYVRCMDVDANDSDKYVERVYFVKEGILMKVVEYEYLPFSYYESLGMDVKDAYFELMNDFVYRGYMHGGYESIAPYYDNNGIVNPYLVTNFRDLSLFSVQEVPNCVKTSNRKQVIFELYFDMFEKSNNCSLK